MGNIYSSLNLSSSIENAVYSAVAGGHEVTIPRDNLTYIGWYGTGYIDMDPATGAAGYIISGGHSGGATVDEWTSSDMEFFTNLGELRDTDPISANITFPPVNSYFPALDGWLDFFMNNQLRFDVTYTINYKAGGSVVINETYKPSHAYPPGVYTFSAGWGTSETRDVTVFGVEIETPDGEQAVVGCDGINLNTKFTPSAPPSVNYKWEKGSCLFGCGDGTFTPADASSTKFKGTDSGDVKAKLEASNTYGTTKADKELKVIAVKKIKAQDSDDSSNSIEDADKSVEADIKTIYVARKDTGTVNISVETDPSIAESDLPSGWKIEKVSGSLDFDGTPGKLSAKLKKNTFGDIVLKVSPCSGSTGHFQVKIFIININFTEDSGQKYGFDDITDSTVKYKQVCVKIYDATTVKISIDGIEPNKIFFKSNNSNIEVTKSATGTPLKITITGKSEYKSLDNGCISAHMGSESGAIGAQLSAYVYKNRNIDYTYYRIQDNDSAATGTSGNFSTSNLLGDPNKWLRQAVLSFTLSGNDDVVHKAYDFYPKVGTTPTRDGQLEFDVDDEMDVITSGYTSGKRIFFYVHNIKGDPTGYSLGTWVFLSDEGNLRTAAHEVGHQFGYWHVPDTDNTNLMYRIFSETKYKLHNHPYKPWDNSGEIPGAAQKRQWDEVH
jgi:hypothetical protein